MGNLPGRGSPCRGLKTVAIVGCNAACKFIIREIISAIGEQIFRPGIVSFRPDSVPLNICNSSPIPLALRPRARFDGAKQE
jgi:hypothetical protein